MKSDSRTPKAQPPEAQAQWWGRSERGLVLAGLLLVLAFNIALRWRLAETPLERDEGEYAYAGQLILQGIPPYKLAYNMKFPGAYLAYAGLMAVGGETTKGIHLGMGAVTSLTALLVFLIGRKLYQGWGGLLAAASCVLLSALPATFGLAGHATHFVALFTTAGSFVLLTAAANPSPWRWGLAGFLFGVAILMKQHAVVFVGMALLWLGVSVWQQRHVIPRLIGGSAIAAFVAGCGAPLVLTAIWLAMAGVWQQFIFWTVEYATQYASAVSAKTAWPGFRNGFEPIFNSAWPLWGLGGIGLLISLVPRRSGPERLVLVLFLGGMLSVVPGFHFRGHYFLAAMPGLALLIAAAGSAAMKRLRERAPQIILTGALVAALGITLWTNKQIWFELPPNQVARQMYSLNPFPEAPQVADYLRQHTAPDERIAVAGSEPQIYFHARRKSATGYIYMYALTEPLPLAQRMRDEFAREMEAAKPRYIVFVDIIPSWVSLSVADQSVLTWWNEFVKYYEPVGAVTLSADAPTSYCWDEAVVRTLNLADCHLVVYRRKEAVGGTGNDEGRR